ncbi:EscU/YscU/HrcU family type III secretion system export apparatus switch protein [Helicobacter kayseriensis]|uniref:EscU/YscU/HrcU family type III secretion system export apparatus switch protein n=1 Tax=Helicobacter kayseriensis TaxID=2905877 RepID=UPI001E295EBF|nr:EscU/YscU/HrcU family type III secretion system export apparatus switch protein [Helicobacter kayseriensis]MCE3046713.1 EscU/YscU/HrcU family type III secretion system export apparatus switch protein [Helicobacter kayseriensis]MCE3047985.1 EscU/YscU/HrcU family type III secretion system export apparatus switch protein [Helicobacter kayseriensis]
MKKAVALAYKAYQDRAPKVIASGKGEIAQKIIAKAKEWNVPLFQNKELVDSIIHLQANEEIPQELYMALVEVFIWLKRCEENAQLSQ